MEEIGTLMQGKENKGRDDLHHEFILNDLADRRFIPNSCRIKEQPTADHEETGQAQQE